MIAKRRVTSASDSADVGSSMMMSRARAERARAISTICCSATERFDTRASGSIVQSNPLGDCPRLRTHPRPVDKAPISKRLPTDEDVFGHRQRRNEIEFLVDGDDAKRPERLAGLRFCSGARPTGLCPHPGLGA